MKTEIDTNNYTKTETNNLLVNKQDTIGANDLNITDTYLLKTALDNFDARTLTNYDSINDLYTKTQIDTTFLNHYLKTEINNNIYNKTEVNNLLTNKQPTINTNDLSITDTYLLETALDNLDARILTNYNSINDLYTKSEIDTTC